MPEDRDQHNGDGEVDLAAGKAQRWRRLTLAAAIDGTAEAEAEIVLGAERAAPPPGLARELGRMQRAAADEAPPGARRLGQIGVEGQQKMMESGVSQQLLIQRCVLSLDGAQHDGQAWTQ